MPTERRRLSPRTGASLFAIKDHKGDTLRNGIKSENAKTLGGIVKISSKNAHFPRGKGERYIKSSPP